MHRRSSCFASTTLALLIVGASFDAIAAPLDPVSIAGVYKDRHPNGAVTGETWTSEDILEIVPVTPTSAYLKAHFEFHNGHRCGLHGVADVEGDTLVYRDRSEDGRVIGTQCILTLRVTKDRLTFEDPDGQCKRLSCGVRGSWDGITIDRSRRRPIRYLDLLRHSADYRNARVEHDAPPAPTPPAPR